MTLKLYIQLETMNLVLKAIMADGTEVTASRFSLLSSRSAVTSLPSPPRRSACRSLTSLPLSLRVRPVGSLPSRCAASVTRGGMRPGEERERRVSDSPRRVTVTGPIQPLLPSALRSSSSSLPRLLFPTVSPHSIRHSLRGVSTTEETR